jgi:hypothetical protein
MPSGEDEFVELDEAGNPRKKAPNVRRRPAPAPAKRKPAPRGRKPVAASDEAASVDGADSAGAETTASE